ncbi:MAG: branched-chain amino acid ABC transporter permease [Patulibacter sp.]
MTSIVQHLVDAASLGALYAVLAIGIALMFGIMNLMNLAYGELIMIGGYSLYALNGEPWPLQLLGCVVITIVAALLMERLAFRPFRGASAPVLLVTSFALSFALQAIATVAFTSRAKGVSLPGFLDSSITVGSVSFSSLNVVSVVAALVLVTGLATGLRRSMIGVQMRAAAESFATARLVGVRADKVIAAAFGISGLFAGVAAILVVAQSGTVTPTIGVAPVLVAFVATIVGGLGSLWGAAWGGFGLGALTVLLQVVLPTELAPYRDAFLYAGVIFVLLVRPQGLIVLRARLERV